MAAFRALVAVVTRFPSDITWLAWGLRRTGSFPTLSHPWCSACTSVCHTKIHQVLPPIVSCPRGLDWQAEGDNLLGICARGGGLLAVVRNLVIHGQWTGKISSCCFPSKAASRRSHERFPDVLWISIQCVCHALLLLEAFSSITFLPAEVLSMTCLRSEHEQISPWRQRSQRRIVCLRNKGVVALSTRGPR